MAFEHPSGIAGAYDRSQGKPEQQSLVFVADRFIQSPELNEAQNIMRSRANRVGRLVANDGDRISGASAIVRPDAGQVILTPGQIYILGDVFPVAMAVLDPVAMTGRVEIGVRLVRTYVGSDDDPTLLGIIDGSLGEGEPGAYRETVSITWAQATDGGTGSFVPVYVLQDGTIIDNTPPPSLSGINAQIAVYDRDANGSYIVGNGCRVTARGKTGGDQVFSIQEGTANINGFKRTRNAALRITHTEDPDTQLVAGELHSFVGTSPNVFTLFHTPISSIVQILLTKQKTVTVTRGGTANGTDALPDTSVTALVEVKQGGTTYALTTDFLKTGDQVDWSPVGAEPATGSSYTVKYNYLAIVSADSFTNTTATVSGGIDGGNVFFEYLFKLPRVDRICLDQNGNAVYVNGISAAQNAMPPLEPGGLLALCQVQNDWVSKPSIINDGVRAVPFAEQWRYYNRVFDIDRLLELERLKSAIDSREPVAKKGIFTEPFNDDTYRDVGVTQTAAVSGGILQLAIDPTFFIGSITAPVMLDWTEEVIVQQELYTICEKINPYQNFTPIPAAMTMTPAADFWQETQTVWTSPATAEFNMGVQQGNAPLVVSTDSARMVDQRTQQAEFLRQIAVSFVIHGFGAGEILDTLTFAGINVKAGGTVTADGSGTITGSFTIPSNIPAGTKLLLADGHGGSQASAYFVGQGLITTDVMQHVTTIQRWTRAVVEPPPAPPGGSSGSPGGGTELSPGIFSYVDPLAQTFVVTEARQIVGVDFRICHIGDPTKPILVDQVTVETGFPTTSIEAEAYFPMGSATIGWASARYNAPVLTLPDRSHAFVVKTDDANHSISAARLGDFDAVNQKYVTSQPYTIGVMLKSSNAETWSPVQDEDLTFRVVAAKFGATTKTVPLGSFNLSGVSDLQVRAAVYNPSPDCSVVFEIVRADSSVFRLLPYQVLQLTSFITETVQLRAVLKGTEKLSPILYAPVYLVAGTIRTSGTYVCRAFPLGTAITLAAYMKAALPSGSTLVVEYDKADGTWITLPLTTTEALSDPAWVEDKYSATPITATQGRLRITITGSPAARPRIGDLGAAAW